MIDLHSRALDEYVRRQDVAEALEYLRGHIEALLRRVETLEGAIRPPPHEQR
jgi:hypothetical protein